ncbi:DUF4162 domain-containing protein [Atopococcus tabaci]|uniref:ATP-binding protein DrrA1-3 family domain-containing protein n=1 Tax=Atopococcus tabaci TaxID=269774 RepID=UPI003C6BEDEF
MAEEELGQMPGVLSVSGTSEGLKVLTLDAPERGKDIFDRVTENGYITTFSQQPPTLEEIFKLKAGEPNE